MTEMRREKRRFLWKNPILGMVCHLMPPHLQWPDKYDSLLPNHQDWVQNRISTVSPKGQRVSTDSYNQPTSKSDVPLILRGGAMRNCQRTSHERKKNRSHFILLVCQKKQDSHNPIKASLIHPHHYCWWLKSGLPPGMQRNVVNNRIKNLHLHWRSQGF